MSANTELTLIDSHVHTDSERFSDDLDAVLRAARANNIVAQIVPATTRAGWQGIKLLCASHPECHPCYGLHPCFFNEHHADDIPELARWLGRESPVAIGECGLDYAIAGADKSRQQHLFSAQLSLAREFDLPIVIHAVRAVEDVIRMIRASGHYNGMVHSYSGSLQQAHRLIDLGYGLGFGGAMTHERANRLRKLVADVPLDAMLLETDAPDQPIAASRGQRNEPARLLDVLHCVAELRNEHPATIAAATTANARKLFRLREPVVKESALAP